MSDAPSYSPPVELGAVMVGGTVSRVEQSSHPDFKAGEWVLGYSGWQEYDLSDGSGLVKIWRKPVSSFPGAGYSGDAGLYRLYGAAGYRATESG